MSKFSFWPATRRMRNMPDPVVSPAAFDDIIAVGASPVSIYSFGRANLVHVNGSVSCLSVERVSEKDVSGCSHELLLSYRDRPGIQLAKGDETAMIEALTAILGDLKKGLTNNSAIHGCGRYRSWLLGLSGRQKLGFLAMAALSGLVGYIIAPANIVTPNADIRQGMLYQNLSLPQFGALEMRPGGVEPEDPTPLGGAFQKNERMTKMMAEMNQARQGRLDRYVHPETGDGADAHDADAHGPARALRAPPEPHERSMLRKPPTMGDTTPDGGQKTAAGEQHEEARLQALKKINAELAAGKKVDDSLLSYLPADVAAHIRDLQAASGGDDAFIPRNVVNQSRAADPFGIPNIPERESWAALMNPRIPFPGGGDIKNSADMKSFGFQP